MILAQSLFEAHLTVNDLDRAVKFYRKVVGLEFATRFANRSNRLEAGRHPVFSRPARKFAGIVEHTAGRALARLGSRALERQN